MSIAVSSGCVARARSVPAGWYSRERQLCQSFWVPSGLASPAAGQTATCHTTCARPVVSGPWMPRATSRISGSWTIVTERSHTRR